MNRLLLLGLLLAAGGCSAGSLYRQAGLNTEREIIDTNHDGNGPGIEVDFYRGKAFYHPLVAVWIGDQTGRFIQTLYVSRSVATGIFEYARQEGGHWVKDEKRAPQSLPYWAHQRGVKASDGLYVPEPSSRVPDAYSGASPASGFVLRSRADDELPPVFRVYLEVNQNWDWNEYWTNDRFPGDENYSWSCQPAVVYEAVVDTRQPGKQFTMKPVGHSHWSGKTGELFPDLSTLTTALEIADSVIVRIR